VSFLHSCLFAFEFYYLVFFRGGGVPFLVLMMVFIIRYDIITAVYSTIQLSGLYSRPFIMLGAQRLSWAILADACFLCNEVARKENGCLG
jgi:hypothetical protein